MMLRAQTLTALRTFEAVGRLMSFSQAASELCVTTGAVSQQIRKLETELGVALFIRQSRSLLLTEAGEKLFKVTTQSLTVLSQTVESIKNNLDGRILRLTVIPSFAFHWLIPRLADFHQHYPRLKVEVKAVSGVLDQAHRDFDLAIDYSPSEFAKGFCSELLMAEELIPVMSPSYRPDFDWQVPECWQDIALLHDTEAWQGASRHEEWSYWFRKQGVLSKNVHKVDVAENYYFNRVDMAIEAAAAGLGVALARKAIVAEALNSARLVAPCPVVTSPASYQLIIPEKQKNDPALRQLIGWLNLQV